MLASSGLMSAPRGVPSTVSAYTPPSRMPARKPLANQPQHFRVGNPVRQHPSRGQRCRSICGCRHRVPSSPNIRGTSSLHSPHGHRMTEPSCRMSIDGDLSNLSRCQPVCSLYLKSGGPRLDLESARQSWRNESSRDFLMDLHETLAEEVFDQMKDGACVALQEPTDGGEFPIDVDFGPADRKLAAFSVPEAADREPLVAACDT